MAQSYSVSLDTIVREHNLAIVNRAVDKVAEGMVASELGAR